MQGENLRERLLLEFFRLENTVSRIKASLAAIQSIQIIPPLTTPVASAGPHWMVGTSGRSFTVTSALNRTT